MRKLLLLTTSLLLFLNGTILAQLASGPMQGYLEMKESMIWLQTNRAAKVYAQYDDLETGWKETTQTNTVTTNLHDGYTAKLIFTNLEPGHRYQYQLFIDDIQVERPYAFEFTTPQLWFKMKAMPDVRLAMGSCAYLNDPEYDKPENPYGGGYEIYSEIVKKDPTTMLWLGDFIYLRPTDFTSRSGYISRYTKNRAQPEIQELMAYCPNFAIWDDHEYGPNDAGGSWTHKETALEAFKLFWANPTYGYADLPGIMSAVQLQDISLILTDNRYNRTEQMLQAPEQILGKRQIEYLIDQLKYSKSPFKLVAIGGQVLNSAAVYENHKNYEDERAYLLRRIQEEGIAGVVFLSGDRHHSEAMRYQQPGANPIWEFTTSPLTSGANPNLTEENDFRIDGSLIQERNFSLLEVTGKRSERRLSITYYSTKGQKLFSYEITQSDTM